MTEDKKHPKKGNLKGKNPMRNVRIEKVVINIGVGESGERLVKAEELLFLLTKNKPVRTESKHKLPTWNLRKKEPIGAKVTLRKKRAIEFLKSAFYAKDNKIFKKNFDNNGNLAFGVKEYIDFPKVKYDPLIGIYGMDICISMERAGFRIKKRRLRRSKINKRVQITKEESMDFIEKKFGVKIE